MVHIRIVCTLHGLWVTFSWVSACENRPRVILNQLETTEVFPMTQKLSFRLFI